MKNNFECIYISIAGYCALTYEITNKGLLGEKCNKCVKYYNNCEACSCPMFHNSKRYCKHCINSIDK